MSTDKGKKDKKVVKFPSNTEAEQSLLCCILIDGDAALELMSLLKVDDFYVPVHKKIFTAMSEIKNPREKQSMEASIDIITVFDQMTRNGSADDTTLDYLSNLSSMLPSAANHRHYFSIVHRDSVLREIIKSCNDILERAYSSEAEDEVEVMRFAEKKIFELANPDDHKNALKHITESANDLMIKLQEIKRNPTASRGLYTGFPRFDRLTNGLQKGDLIILAARPSVGKTAFALNFAANIAKNTTSPKTIAIFSLEMPSMQLSQRILCNLSQVTMDSVNSGELERGSEKRLMESVKLLSNSKIYINDSSIMSPGEIMSQCRKLCRGRENVNSLDLIIVDYLQLMSNQRSGGESDNRQQEVASMSRMMKIMAKELNCPIVLLSQLNRGIEARKDKMPMLSDLRESGSIEQDADIVMFLSREIEEEKHDSPIILNVAKHRNGALDSIRLVWNGANMNFTESEDQSEYGKKKPAPEEQT